MYNRYDDINKFVTDPDKLELVNGSEIYISGEDDYDIVVDLEGQAGEFERLRPLIAFVAQNICELDNIAQKFNRFSTKSNWFPCELVCVFLSEPDIILEYWGTDVNTVFHVIFERKESEFVLKSFGTVRNIPPDWDSAPTEKKRSGNAGKTKSLLRRFFSKK